MSEPGRLRIALAQRDFHVGDIAGNVARIQTAAEEARDRLEADLVVFPELALTGYPPEDLLLRHDFRERARRALGDLAAAIQGIDAVVGLPLAEDGRLYNACVLIRDGAVAATYRKCELPNYSVFDEKRYFTPGQEPCVVSVKGVPVGLTICEDAWIHGPLEATARAGAGLILNINASPWHVGKPAEREWVLRQRQHEAALPLVYVNQVGGQDELVFDGASMVMAADGNVAVRLASFREVTSHVDFAIGAQPELIGGELAGLPPDEDGVYQALVLGIRDYIYKNGFPGALVGLSGGIDSALALALAVDALGVDQVQAVGMPSRYTSDASREDARTMAEQLGVAYEEISIEAPFGAFLDALAPCFAGLEPDATEENIQARCRGVLLMALSNKTGRLLLTTGNKSEMAVGYATLYGDMAGGFAPIRDVPKTMVYRLARYRNSFGPAIPERVIERPPSAELAPDQKDEDSLPPYPVLDRILELYIEQDQGPEAMVAAGIDPELVCKVVRMVDRAEYKRRQAPPGVRISRRAFGRDRRYPITSGYVCWLT